VTLTLNVHYYIAEYIGEMIKLYKKMQAHHNYLNIWPKNFSLWV